MEVLSIFNLTHRTLCYLTSFIIIFGFLYSIIWWHFHLLSDCQYTLCSKILFVLSSPLYTFLFLFKCSATLNFLSFLSSRFLRFLFFNFFTFLCSLILLCPFLSPYFLVSFLFIPFPQLWFIFLSSSLLYFAPTYYTPPRKLWNTLIIHSINGSKASRRDTLKT